MGSLGVEPRSTGSSVIARGHPCSSGTTLEPAVLPLDYDPVDLSSDSRYLYAIWNKSQVRLGSSVGRALPW